MSSLATKMVDINDLDEEFLTDVVDGLSQQPKTLPCKYFYDEAGSQLFESICETSDYYVTRTECLIYDQYAAEMARLMGEKVLIIEPGAGAVKKVAFILDALEDIAGFIPMDISPEMLNESSQLLAKRFPELEINPMVVDFSNHASLGEVFQQLPVEQPVSKRVVFFPGSTIGNFHPEDAKQFLKVFSRSLSTGDVLLIGVDLVKDTQVLENAYDDAEGVTADFNLNLLHRINNELNGNFNLDDFRHQAIFNPQDSRIEMHLVSTKPQQVRVADQLFEFDEHETIHTENSYKYSVEDFVGLAEQSGYDPVRVWTDEHELFSVYYLEVA